LPPAMATRRISASRNKTSARFRGIASPTAPDFRGLFYCGFQFQLNDPPRHIARDARLINDLRCGISHTNMRCRQRSRTK
jgi:hypothetical protein